MSRFIPNSTQAICTPLETLNQLRKTLDILEKKESLLKKKASVEADRARLHLMAMNEIAAIHCLRRKLGDEHKIGILGRYKSLIHNQMIVLQGATAAMETIEALRTGPDTLKRTNTDMIMNNNEDKMLDEINERTEKMNQIPEILSAPIGAAADFDEDEMEVGLEELEGAEIEEQLLQPATTAPPAAVNVPSGRQQTRLTVHLKPAEMD